MSPVKEALMSNKQMYSANSVTVPVKTCANAMFCLSKVLWKRHPGLDQPGGGHDVTSFAVTNANQGPEIAGWKGPTQYDAPTEIYSSPCPSHESFLTVENTACIQKHSISFDNLQISKCTGFGNNLPSYITCLSGPATLAVRPPHENAFLLSPFFAASLFFCSQFLSFLQPAEKLIF